MAHFVEIDDLHKVIRGAVLDNKDTQDSSGNEVESIGSKYLSGGFGGTWKRTSYNTSGGVHSLGGTPFRKNYAGIGYTFDAVRDAFYTPQPFDSWTLNEDTCQWQPPTAKPDDGKEYTWDEENTQWVENPE
jgi:hypothetical protein